MTSPDGETWASYSTPPANWFSVTYGNGKYVAIAYGGINRVLISPDGENWTAYPAVQDGYWQSVTYGDGQFVAVGASGSSRVMTSPDGENWLPVLAAEDNHWQSVTYGNGKFVAVAYSGTNRVMTSSDGTNWTAHSAAGDCNWKGVTYGNGKFVAVGVNGTDRIMTSPDGENWTAYSAPEDNSWESVTYGSGNFVAIAISGTTNKVMTSPDGENWTAYSAAEDNMWQSVTYGDGKFVAVAINGTNRVMTLDAPETSASGLYFDDKLLYTSDHAGPIIEGVNRLTNLVVNNAEEIEALAPTILKATWEYTGSTTPSPGQYTLTPAGNNFGDATKLILNPTTGGVDYTVSIDAIVENSALLIQNVDDPYGLSARVETITKNPSGDYEFTLIDVRAVDFDPSEASRDGDALIKFRSPTSGYGPVWHGDVTPTTMPDGSPIQTGTMFLNTAYFRLLIWVGGAWMAVS